MIILKYRYLVQTGTPIEVISKPEGGIGELAPFKPRSSIGKEMQRGRACDLYLNNPNIDLTFRTSSDQWRDECAMMQNPDVITALFRRSYQGGKTGAQIARVPILSFLMTARPPVMYG